MGLNALVTGGTRGIGAGIVQALAAAGHQVAFCGRGGTEQYGPVAEQLSRQYGVKVRYFQCDISDCGSHEALLDAVERELGPLEMLVNNAGVAPNVRADLLEMGIDSFERLIRINAEGPFFLTQALAKRMVARKGDGVFRLIVNVSSISADYASVNRGEYCLSKAAVSMATKLWATRLADEGVAVYEVRPGIIKSDMTSTVSAKYDKLIAEGCCLQRRWGVPEDIGKAMVMLASGALAYSTGQVINVDGGFSVQRF